MLADITAARRIMERDPERWLYPLLELRDPVLASGISCYVPSDGGAEGELAIVSDYDGGAAVRLYSDRLDLLEEAASDPAVGCGTRFCFCAGLPAELRDRDGFSAGAYRLYRDDARRTLERYGLFGVQQTRLRAPVPPGFVLSEAERGDFRIPADFRSCGSLPDCGAGTGRRRPSSLRRPADLPPPSSRS